MKLEINTIWSPDLNPPSEGLPSDNLDFDVFVQVSISEAEEPGKEVFNFRVCSVSALANTEAGQFINHTLVLNKFDWSEIGNRIDKLLLQASSCENWDCVVNRLNPFIEYTDQQ